MAQANKVTKPSLFPSKNSLQEVTEVGLAQLPITNPNDLVALLQLHQNTINKINQESVAS